MDKIPKGEYRKITTTVPQWAYGLLIQESARRKIAGEPNQLLSGLLREAITDYLKKLQDQPQGGTSRTIGAIVADFGSRPA